MKVTAIKQQVRQASRYSIFVDGRYTCSLSDTALLKSKVLVGQELDVDQLARLKQLSTTDKAYGSALRYVALRSRSEWEIATYLRRKQVEPHIGQDIIERLRGSGFIDDQAFARSWVANRRLLKATSKRRLVQELQQKHVEPTIIELVLREDQTDDATVIKEVVERKRRLPRYRDDNLRLMQYLARQGYDYDAIKAALTDSETSIR
jgi:regulatory protein